VASVQSAVCALLRRPGVPLGAGVRADMESRFRHNFSHVRVYVGNEASESAQALGARAYTVGPNVVFGARQHRPDSSDGRRLLAHELAHVVQQSGDSISATPAIGEDERLEQEARVAAASLDGPGLGPIGPLRQAGPAIMREVISATPSPSGGGGKPPTGLTGCHVFLGGRRIDDFVAGTVLQFRHLYIDVYEGPGSYALIESGPVGSTTSGTSGAWVKSMDWDARGIQWELHPDDCPSFIACLKKKTADYHAAAHPYHYSHGPNSNSFAWWVLDECGLDISFLISSWPYIGVDYWKKHATPAATPAPSGAGGP
jgi:hypothetical protein